MKKEYAEWHRLKSDIQENENPLYFYRREIWFCSIGLNVGHEQDGKNELFERPVLIIKKFNKDTFLGIPLTTSTKKSQYAISYEFRGETYTAIISQIRLLDRKRLRRKVGLLPKDNYEEILVSLKEML